MKPKEIKRVDFETQRALGHVKELVQKIGPRLSGTQGERKAAEYIHRQFMESGLETHIQEVGLTDRVWATRLTTLAFLAVFTAALFLPPIHLLGVFVLFLSLRWLAPKLAPTTTTRNVIGKLRREKAKRRLLITAHYDTALDVIHRKLNSSSLTLPPRNPRITDPRS